MGVPTSEVGYILATTGRGDHKVHKGHVVALGAGGVDGQEDTIPFCLIADLIEGNKNWPVLLLLSSIIQSSSPPSVFISILFRSVDKWQLATGWTVQGSNPGRGEIFHTCPDQPWSPPSLLYNGYRVFLGGKAAGMWR
jgi:hypothetical protein